MRQAKVYTNGILAGILTETDERNYLFQYDDSFLMNATSRAIS